MDSMINYFLSVFQEYGWFLLLLLAMYRYKRVWAIAAITVIVFFGFNRPVLLTVAILCILSRPDIPMKPVFHVYTPIDDKKDRNEPNPDGVVIAKLQDETEED